MTDFRVSPSGPYIPVPGGSGATGPTGPTGATGATGPTLGWPGSLAINATTTGHTPTITAGDSLVVEDTAKVSLAPSGGSPATIAPIASKPARGVQFTSGTPALGAESGDFKFSIPGGFAAGSFLIDIGASTDPAAPHGAFRVTASANNGQDGALLEILPGHPVFAGGNANLWGGNASGNIQGGTAVISGGQNGAVLPAYLEVNGSTPTRQGFVQIFGDVGLYPLLADPGPNASLIPQFYAKNVAGQDQLFWRTPTGIVYQITPPAAGVTVGPIAGLPPASGSGRLYITDNAPVSFVDDPITSSWMGSGRSLIVEPPAAASSYTVVPAANMALIQDGPTILVAMTSTALDVMPAALLASPSLGAGNLFAVELQAVWNAAINIQYPGIQLFVGNGTTAGVSQLYGVLIYQNGMLLGFAETQWTLGGGRAAEGVELQFSASQLVIGDATVRLRLLSDGTLLHYQHSVDGIEWYDKASGALPAGLTHHGFSIGACVGAGSDPLSKGRILKHKLLTGASAVYSQVIDTATGAGVPIQCTTLAPHNLRSGDMVAIHGAGGNTAMNKAGGPAYDSGAWWVKVLDPTNFLLLKSTGNGVYTPGSATFYRVNR